ncbi:hypothetical protein [Aliiroseovarius subalbicans]|uniref:hypothetical protein n=1 Tax=Aliiroseovarius subalbicans TaxID=2925840 RepID=UPI001F5667C8|nr:hypothetical protein [Aliiroseovarius subalbicans]MCI2400729.1 hypothetical protein [Aliiroseovarius subalbicans]
MFSFRTVLFAAILPVSLSWPAFADFPVVEDAVLSGTTISVTLRHPDTGWDHYADGWEVLMPDGTSLGLRVLAHPHVAEQPFTRSLGGLSVPEGVKVLHIRARCSRDGWSDQVFILPVP